MPGYPYSTFAADHQDDADEAIEAAHMNAVESALNELKTLIGSESTLLANLTAVLNGTYVPVSAVQTKRTAGNVTLNGTAYTDVAIGIGDLTIPAAAGNNLLIWTNGSWGGEAVTARLDAVTIVASTFTNYVSGEGASGLGVSSWTGVAGLASRIGSPILYTVQAGDVEAGSVTLRLVGKTATAGAKVLAAAVAPLWFGVQNLGGT